MYKFLARMFLALFLFGATAWGQFVTAPLAVSAPGGSTATVTWTTCANASTQLDYGTSIAYGTTTPFDPTLNTSHTVNLTGLTPGTLYFLRIDGTDANGSVITWPFSFMTKIITPVSLALVPPSATVIAGGTRQFTAIRTNSDATTTDVTTQVKWSSSDLTKATINPTTGLSTGVAAGTSNITAALSQPQYTQVNSGQSNSAASIAVTYPLVQVAGSTNVVAVGWNAATGTVSSVADSAGNTYASAVGPTRGTGLSDQIFTAKNIAGGANTVTVTFSGAQPFIDVRILEYAAIDTTTPVDVAVGAAGTGQTASSGNATSTNATDIIVGSGMTIGVFTAPGASFTSRLITPTFGDIIEDSLVNTAGTKAAVATTKNLTDNWVMNMVALKGNAGQSATGALTVTAPLTNYSFFTTQVPALINGSDNPAEFGLQFTSDVTGSITAIKFYRETGQTGSNLATVWDVATGTKIGQGTGTFTATGWQTITLPTPVAVVANKAYIVSVHLNNGFYGYTRHGYDVGRNIGPLHAPIAAGWFAYGATPVFPNQTYLNTDWSIDLIFSTTVVAPPPVHTVTVAWNAATGANTYTVLRQTGNCTGVFVAIKTGITGVNYTDNTVVSGQATQYCYAATSTNATGTSGFSNSSTVVVP